MPGPLLSSEETDALLDAMRAADGSAPDIEGADLVSPEPRIRSALPSVDRHASLVVTETRTALIRHSGCAHIVEAHPAEVTPYSLVTSSLEPGTALAMLQATDGSFALLSIGPGLVAFLLERQMGAPLLTDGTAVEHTRTHLSPVDRRVLAPIVADIARAVGRIWCEKEEVFRLARVVTDPAELPELSDHEPLMRFAMHCAPAGRRGGDVVLALTASAVTATVGIPDDEPPATPTAEERAWLEARVGMSSVRISAVLGEAQTTIGQILALDVGDVVRLETVPGEASRLRVEGETILLGRPVVRHGNLAVEIVSPS
ncbi:MAG: FliM/FliN family flagellar motor switch protein [Myxococcales bacterium]|nr:FliM/FliN family flagellar motor switch protein [Myxococcales bacterium]